MKKVLIVILLISTVLLASCASKNEPITPGVILKELNIGMSADADIAEDINYSIINKEIGKITFVYSGYHFEFCGSTKKNYMQLEPADIEKGLSVYIINKSPFSFNIYKAKLSTDSDMCRTICEWVAETATGEYKCFYTLYSPDYCVNEENVMIIGKVLTEIINM